MKCAHSTSETPLCTSEVPNLWKVVVPLALPAENLRLDRPLLLSRVSRFAPDKRKLRALDSADGQAPRPSQEGHLLFMHRSVRCL